MRDYKNIKAYQLADKLAIEIYQVTKDFPREELYGLISQLRRACVSVATNIVEGSSRQHLKDYLQFLYISRGSLAETGYLIELSNKLGYVTNEKFTKVDMLRQEVAKTLYGLISVVAKDIQNK